MGARSSFAIALSKRIRAARAKTGLSIAEIAARSTLSTQLLRAYERGTEPKVSKFIQLAQALGVSAAELCPEMR